MNKFIVFILLILMGCTASATGTPKPTMGLETAIAVLTFTPPPTQEAQLTYTPPATYTPLPTYTEQATQTQYPTLTPYPTATKTPIPELFKMLERPLPIMNSPTAILQVWCHFQYNYWIVRPWEMVFYRTDPGGLKETWCVTHNGHLQ